MKNLIILGASGSIGKQTLAICKRNPQAFNVIGVSVNTSISFLETLLKEVKSIRYACVGNHHDCERLALQYPNIIFFHDEKGLLDLVMVPIEALVVNGLVGFVGMLPTIKSIESGKNIAIANKESLVCAGEIINDLLAKKHVKLFAIDSEHSALQQCLAGEDKDSVKRLIITGSGGPFRDLQLEDLKNVNREQALKHPNWQMGAKITIDSATLVNKGLEIIEAHQIFGLNYDKIDVVMHYESIVHGLVEFNDGSIKASMGSPSMEIPILYALNESKHTIPSTSNFDFSAAFTLRFKPFDFKRFEALALAYEVGKKGGTLPTVFNGANEEAVQAFLENRIMFYQIVPLIKNAVLMHHNIQKPSIDDIINADKWARDIVKKLILQPQEDLSC